MHIYKERERQRQRQRETEAERDRERDRETESERERETESIICHNPRANHRHLRISCAFENIIPAFVCACRDVIHPLRSSSSSPSLAWHFSFCRHWQQALWSSFPVAVLLDHWALPLSSCTFEDPSLKNPLSPVMSTMYFASLINCS